MPASRSDWAAIRLTYRRRVFATINKIEDGSVSQSDVDKLRNFCAVALMLMGKVQEPVWRKAERDAELAAWLRNEIEDRDDDETEGRDGEDQDSDDQFREDQPGV